MATPIEQLREEKQGQIFDPESGQVFGSATASLDVLQRGFAIKTGLAGALLQAASQGISLPELQEQFGAVQQAQQITQPTAQVTQPTTQSTQQTTQTQAPTIQTATATAKNLGSLGFFTVATTSTGPTGETIFNVFRPTGVAVKGDEAAGLGLTREVIEALPSGQEPASFVETQFGNTATGKDITKTTGQSVVDYFNNLTEFINNTLKIGEEEVDVEEARADITDFFKTRKTATQILQEEFALRGITEKTTLLTDLDKIIREDRDRLRDLPEDIRKSLEDVGVTQSQLNRLVVKESTKPIEALNRLLENRNALASEINTAMSFARQFADTRLEDQATKLAGLEFELNSELGDLADLEDDKKDLLNLVLAERKQVLELALNNPDAGINTFEDSVDEAIAKAGETPGIVSEGFTPTQTLKLEQAGLANAPRQQQLDFLFGDTGGGDDDTGGNDAAVIANLIEQKLDVNLRTTTNKLKSAPKNRILNKGVPLDVVDAIWEAIISGESLDFIRNELKRQFMESPNDLDEAAARDLAFGYLDTFVQTLQEEGPGTSGGGDDNPFE